ncbi:MAG: carbohydrate binding family 9 domain-containing protein [Candidatus Eisenbacteria bacterium]|nr:carbohydrate binding family 9 domain-containing protein [Candidatus Eisenbacteria bacterium]
MSVTSARRTAIRKAVAVALRVTVSSLALSCLLLGAQAREAVADSQKTLKLRRVDAAPSLDGVVDQSWSRADSVSDFVQFQPYVGREPSRKTTAKAMTTEKALYCLMVCLDERKNIQRTTATLDQGSGDIVSLMLDTFGDRRTAYKFAVSASGARADCRLLDDARNRDYNWDGVWFSAAKIYDWGFVIEMEVPYRSVQYDESLTEWGLDFDRWIPTLTEDIYWCAYEQNEGQRISKFGKLVFEDFRPSVKGLNLEVYPVAISKVEYLHDSEYDFSPNAGVDVFYNPSQRLTFQLTANPDFAQIEADPFEFNISRYETYFSERRPFFTEGNEVFMPSGKESGSGFYSPLELFYSRRIGRKLPDGSEVPLLLGTRAFGRLNGWEYGGFVAVTDEKDYELGGEKLTEAQALFSSVRLKKQVLGNSSVGLLYVGKNTEYGSNGVVDLDGAFRASDWQLAYQIARSYRGSEGDFGGSSCLKVVKENYLAAVRTRYVGEEFDVGDVGYVPWKGTTEVTGLCGPMWYLEKGPVQQILIYAGGVLNNEKVDAFTDRMGALGVNMQFRKGWGYEVSAVVGRSKDMDREFDSFDANLSSWFNMSPKWEGSLSAGYSRTYNFFRDYLAFYAWTESYAEWRALDVLALGTTLSFFVEGNPDGEVEDVTVNSRPYVSVTPFNNLNVRMYLDNVYVRSTEKVQQVIGGFLLSYNFRPKSWIYLAVNEVQDRSDEYDAFGTPLPNRMHVTDRACVLKLKYLFYF